MTSQIFLYFLASLFGLLIPFLLDAYGCKKEALELAKYITGFLIGFGLAKVIL